MIMVTTVNFDQGREQLGKGTWKLADQFDDNMDEDAQCPIRGGSGQILGCGFLGLNPLLSSPRNGFCSIFGHLIEFGLVAQLSKQPQNGFYKVNQDMDRKFKTARVGPPLHGIGSVESIVLIREHPQFMWPACDFFIFGYKLAIFGHLSSIFLVAKNNHK